MGPLQYANEITVTEGGTIDMSVANLDLYGPKFSDLSGLNVTDIAENLNGVTSTV